MKLKFDIGLNGVSESERSQDRCCWRPSSPSRRNPLLYFRRSHSPRCCSRRLRYRVTTIQFLHHMNLVLLHVSFSWNFLCFAFCLWLWFFIEQHSFSYYKPYIAHEYFEYNNVYLSVIYWILVAVWCTFCTTKTHCGWVYAEKEHLVLGRKLPCISMSLPICNCWFWNWIILLFWYMILVSI